MTLFRKLFEFLSRFKRRDSWMLGARMDLAKLAKRFVDPKAIAQGRREQPSTAAQDIDVPEQEIVQHVENLHLDVVAETVQDEHQLKNTRATLAAQCLPEYFDECVDDVQQHLQRLYMSSSQTLQEVWRRLQALRADYRGFCRQHGINREAVYPESHLWHLALLVLMVLVESMANTTMFAKGSNGIVGGFMEALVVSGLNVLLSFSVGMALRGVNASHLGLRCLAVLAGVGYACVWPLYHLTIGHYRTSLVIDSQGAATAAISRVLENPLSLDDLHSWMLVIIGLVFGCASLIDGYKWDDPIPKFGAKDRRLKMAESEYFQLKEDYLIRIHMIADSQLAAVDHLLANAKAAVAGYRASLGESKQLLRAYQQTCVALADACIALQLRYRELNASIRSTPPPAYFREEPPRPFEPDDTLAQDLAMVEAELATLDVPRRQEELQRQANETRRQIQALDAHQLEQAPDVFERIETNKPALETPQDEEARVSKAGDRTGGVE